MNRIPGIRLFLAATVLAASLTVPAAHARGAESPRPAARVESGWLGMAMRWLEGITGLRGPATRSTETTGKADSGAATTTGGSCIDPQGEPLPWCGIFD